MVFVEYKGKRFVKDMKHGYYHAHFGDKVKSLHRVVWEDNFGEIPNGFHIHHIDGNKDNNEISNLEMINAHDHLSNHSKANFEANREEITNRLLEAQELAKSWHKSEEGREWHSKHGKAVFSKISELEFECVNCGNKFKSKNRHARFCSNKCRSAFRRKLHVDDVERRCEVCGTVFITNKYSKRRFCSWRCGREGNKD